jgi:2-polyprenyl-6-methoxyphenol hydroxylase-like FAD-dependent oxidoreductase
MAEKYPNFQVRFSNRFTGCQQDEPGKVRVGVSTPKGEQFMEADYVVGCDGGTSAVQRALCIPFQGFTWNDFRLVATNIRYPYFEKYGIGPANMIVDPEDWGVVVLTGKAGDGIWRVAFSVHADMSEEEIRKIMPEKLKLYLPETEEEKKQCEVLTAQPYWTHQRMATKMVVGRVILAGDAAHVRSRSFEYW